MGDCEVGGEAGGGAPPGGLRPPAPARPLTCQRIIEEAAAVFGVGEQDVCGHSTARPAIAARQAAMYACRVLADESLASIGRRFGGRDDTTVLHAVRTIDQLMTQPNAIHAKVVQLTIRLGERPGPGRVGRRRAG